MQTFAAFDLKIKNILIINLTGFINTNNGKQKDLLYFTID